MKSYEASLQALAKSLSSGTYTISSASVTREEFEKNLCFSPAPSHRGLIGLPDDSFRSLHIAH